MPVTRSLGSALLALAACKGAHEPRARGNGEGSGSGSGGGSGGGSAAIVAVADAATVDAGPACVPSGKVLASVEANKRLRICSDDKKACVDADPETGALSTAPYAKIESPALAAAKVEKRDKSVVACFKDKCRDIGKNARDVIGRDPDLPDEHLLATTDLGALVIPKVAPQLWDIGADKELKLRPPSGERDIGQMMPVGNHVFVSWLPAAEAMYRRSGGLVAPLFSDGTQLAMIDDTRSVALTPDHRVLIFGEPEHVIELGSSVGNYDDWVQEPGALAVLADGTVAIVIERAAEAQVVLVDPQRGTVFRRWPLPRCPG